MACRTACAQERVPKSFLCWRGHKPRHGRWHNGARRVLPPNPEQADKDIALIKYQFNQISPENDLKWALIHPREGADGYSFDPADAFVNFGVTNQMYIVGHTLVWHAQTPNWVFLGTNLPPGMTNTPSPEPAGTTNTAGTNAAGSGRF
jgi:GH35 family endo-1,4-beta-xylanase